MNYPCCVLISLTVFGEIQVCRERFIQITRHITASVSGRARILKKCHVGNDIPDEDSADGVLIIAICLC